MLWAVTRSGGFRELWCPACDCDLSGGVGFGGSALDEQAPPRPNVVLIIRDDVYDGVGPLGGHPRSTSLGIDACAAGAAVFENVFCPTSVRAVSGNLFWAPWCENEVRANSKRMMRDVRDKGCGLVGSGRLKDGVVSRVCGVGSRQRCPSYTQMRTKAVRVPRQSMVIQSGSTVRRGSGGAASVATMGLRNCATTARIRTKGETLPMAPRTPR